MKKEVVKLYNISKNKIDIIEGGIDSQDFNLDISIIQVNILRDKYNLNVHDGVLLYAGRIVPQKGLVDLIKAMSILKKKEDFKLLIAGRTLNTVYYNEIINLITKLRLGDRVMFVGHINQFEMRTLINLSEAVVSPSLYEPFGMINLQAAVMGKVVVTTNIVGSNHLLHRYRKMIIIKPNSAVDLAGAINKINTIKSIDDHFHFSGYSWFNVVNKISHIFKKCLKSK
jgi:glycosyltransferase involved in cell wall biosynthesis